MRLSGTGLKYQSIIRSIWRAYIQMLGFTLRDFDSANLESSLGSRLLSVLDESDAEGPYELYWRNPGCEWDWS